MGKGVTRRSSMLDVHGESVPLGDDGGHQTTPFFEFMPAPEIWGWASSVRAEEPPDEACTYI
jgi:hypothetical protein